MEIAERFWPRIEEITEERERKSAQMKRGDELPSGVLEMVKVYVATKRQIAVGDKMPRWVQQGYAEFARRLIHIYDGKLSNGDAGEPPGNHRSETT